MRIQIGTWEFVERVNALLAKTQTEVEEHQRLKNDLAALFAIRPHYTTLDGLLNNVKRAIDDRQKYAAEIGRLREGGRLPFSAALLEEVTVDRDAALERTAELEQTMNAVCIAANVSTRDLVVQAVGGLRNEAVDLRAELAGQRELAADLATLRTDLHHMTREKDAWRSTVEALRAPGTGFEHCTLHPDLVDAVREQSRELDRLTRHLSAAEVARDAFQHERDELERQRKADCEKGTWVGSATIWSGAKRTQLLRDLAEARGEVDRLQDELSQERATGAVGSAPANAALRQQVFTHLSKLILDQECIGSDALPYLVAQWDLLGRAL